MIVTLGPTAARGPSEFSRVHGISYDIFDITVFKAISFYSSVSIGVEIIRYGLVTLTFKEHIEYPLYQRSVIVGNVLAILNCITDRRSVHYFAPADFFKHTPFNFFGEVNAVVFVHSFYHGFDEHGHFIVAHILRDRHNIDTKLTEH